MPNALVTGASRGLGLEWTRQLLGDGWHVAATARDPGGATELAALVDAHSPRGRLVALDVDDPAAVREGVERLRDGMDHLDLVISNAGVWADPARATSASAGPLAELDADAVHQVLRTNVVGALAVAQATAPLLAAAPGHAVLAQMTSGLGSLARATFVVDHAYQLSKAALNMATRLLAAELADQGITVVSLDPGWVRTDMGGPNARVEPEESVAGLREVLTGLSPDQSGQILNRRGEQVPF